MPEFQPEFSLQGLAEFSHIWVIFHFHKNTNLTFQSKVHPPRLAGKSTGVFATRSPHRPNPVGLSVAKIEGIQDSRILLSGLDIIDETPVFDIKPYLPSIEAIPAARGSWTDVSSTGPEILIKWDPEALRELEEWAKNTERPFLKDLVESTLKLDPRPTVYRGFEGQEAAKYRQIHAVRLFEGDVKFQFVEPQVACVLKVIPHYIPNA